MAHIQLSGNLTADPEVRTFDRDGETRAVTSFSIADHKRARDADGKWVDVAVTFYRVTAWQHLAELASSLSKGQLVHVHGVLVESVYERKPTPDNPADKGRRLEITATEIYVAL
jgi:single stranded DNA-binding protein